MQRRIDHRFNAFFSRLKFKYKLTIYFTLFGLLIGYLSLILYTTLATRNLKHIVTEVVDEWVANSDQPPDILESLIGKSYTKKINTILPFISVAAEVLPSSGHNSKINLYYFSWDDSRWFKLYHEKSCLIARGEIQTDEYSSISKALKNGTVSTTYTPFYGKSDTVQFWINLTRPKDKNIYLARIVSDRMGFLAFIGGKHFAFIYALSLTLFSFIISKRIAIHISKPISMLSVHTAGIAAGDLELRTEIISMDEIGMLSASINSMADRIKENIDSMNTRMETISVMNKIDKAVLSSVSRTDLIDRVTAIVSELFKDCMVAITLIDREKERYVILSHYIKGIKERKSDGVILTFNTLGTENIEKNKNFFVIDKLTDEGYLNLLNSISHHNYIKLVNLPINLNDEYIGSLIVGKDADKDFSDFEMETLKVLADQSGVAMKTVKSFEERESLFLGILTALAKTIDTKSKWTSGHSGRVTEYAEKLAIKMGMDESFLSYLRISANLHDIGKIGVPERILDKPDLLTDEEFNIIKNHPKDGASIVVEIPGHEKLINGILFHHEAWNGEGYPFGLSGRGIPLMGRLIAVADVYDALISDRPYRSSMKFEDAINILISEKGKLLDPGIVDLMIEILVSENKIKLLG